MSTLNTISPGTFTSAILIADVITQPKGSSDSIPQMTRTGGASGPTVSAALEIQSTLGSLLNARLDQTQIDDLIPYPGMQLYNTTEAAIQFYYGGSVDAWVTPMTESGTGVEDDIVIFGSNVGSIIDSRVALYLNGGLSDISNLYIGVNNGNNSPGALSVQNVSFGLSNLTLITDGARNYSFGVGNLAALTTAGDNLAIGFESLASNTVGNKNIALGTSAMSVMNDLSDNTDNVAIGYSTFGSATAILHGVALGGEVGKLLSSVGECTFVGYNIASQTTGSVVDLTAVGSYALEAVDTGAARLTAVGWSALQSASTAVRCSAFGYLALSKITVSAGGADSNAFGNQCMLQATSALSSDGFGSQVFDTATTLLNSCAFGEAAGGSQLQYTDCLFLGQGADASVNNLTNAIAIGQGSSVAVSNAMVLGKSGTFVGINTSSPTAAHLTNSGSEAVNVTLVTGGSFPYVATSTDSVIIGYPTNNQTITLPDAAPLNYGRKFVIACRSTGLSDVISVFTTGGQQVNSNNNIGNVSSKTFLSVANDGISGNPGYVCIQYSNSI